MTVRIWTAAQVKETAKGLREAGYEVVRSKNSDHDSYVATIGDGDETVVLKALRAWGKAKYLVRYDSRLFGGA